MVTGAAMVATALMAVVVRPTAKKYQFTHAIAAAPARMTIHSVEAMVGMRTSSARGAGLVARVLDGLGDLRGGDECGVVADGGAADGDLLDRDALERLEGLVDAADAVAAAHAVDADGDAFHGVLLERW